MSPVVFLFGPLVTQLAILLLEISFRHTPAESGAFFPPGRYGADEIRIAEVHNFARLL
jgi:hypothetical protein